MKTKIVTICGSYRFIKRMIEVQRQLTELGYIVLMPAINCDRHDKEWYLTLHKKKIDMSDMVFIVDVGGYIGEHTDSELQYAYESGKEIMYYSKTDWTMVEAID